MKSATVREVQHNLAALLRQVQGGQEIAVTRRGKVVARIVPAQAAATSRRWGRRRWTSSTSQLRRRSVRATS
jgi:prevent-host-death family protein